MTSQRHRYLTMTGCTEYVREHLPDVYAAILAAAAVAPPVKGRKRGRKPIDAGKVDRIRELRATRSTRWSR